MKLVSIATAMVCGFAALPTCAVRAHADDHHAAHAVPAQVAVPSTRWESDVPLREGMGRVGTALDELRHYEMGHMPASIAVERAVSIEGAIAFLFAHCKLAPDADAALHGMLVPLLAAAQRLKNDPQDVAAVAAMRTAIENYPRYFIDSQWPVAAKSTHAGH